MPTTGILIRTDKEYIKIECFLCLNLNIQTWKIIIKLKYLLKYSNL